MWEILEKNKGIQALLAESQLLMISIYTEQNTYTSYQFIEAKWAV